MKNINIENKGFSLIETAILVGVTAIMATMIMPDVVSFLKFYEQRTEQENLYEIKLALAEYAKDWGSLPDEATWSDDLAPYTDLSPSQILTDMWYRDRQYRKFTYDFGVGEAFRGITLSADYAIVMSYGSDNVVDDNTIIFELYPVDPADDLEPFDADIANAKDTYANLTMAGDDLIAVYTDLPIKIKNIQITENRIRTLKSAIINYAESKKLMDISPTAVLYRPMATAVAGVPDSNNNYDADMVDEVDLYINDGTVNPQNRRFNTTQADNNGRRAEMISLVRFLGLSDNYCCNALVRYDDDADASTQPVEVPFFYYSNPRPFNGAGCGARPSVATANNRFLEPRIMKEQSEINADVNNCG